MIAVTTIAIPDSELQGLHLLLHRPYIYSSTNILQQDMCNYMVILFARLIFPSKN